MKWIALQFYRFLWTIWRVRLNDLYVTTTGETRSRSDERIVTRARKAIALGGRQMAFRLCCRHSMPQHAFRWVTRETDEALLEQSRRAWSEQQAENMQRNETTSLCPPLNPSLGPPPAPLRFDAYDLCSDSDPTDKIA